MKKRRSQVGERLVARTGDATLGAAHLRAFVVANHKDTSLTQDLATSHFYRTSPETSSQGSRMARLMLAWCLAQCAAHDPCSGRMHRPDFPGKLPPDTLLGFGRFWQRALDGCPTVRPRPVVCPSPECTESVQRRILEPYAVGRREGCLPHSCNPLSPSHKRFSNEPQVMNCIDIPPSLHALC